MPKHRAHRRDRVDDGRGPRPVNHRHALSVGGDDFLAPRHTAGQLKSLTVAELGNRLMVANRPDLVSNHDDTAYGQLRSERRHTADGLKGSVVGLGDKTDHIGVPDRPTAEVLG